jgi:serine/threonine protein kinase
MVLEYADSGTLRNYLDTSYDESNWEVMLRNLHCIASGLDKIHEQELIHRDLHVGNILKFHVKSRTSITDMGLCKPADYNASENTKNNYVVFYLILLLKF